jgi:hypothetical protein
LRLLVPLQSFVHAFIMASSPLPRYTSLPLAGNNLHLDITQPSPSSCMPNRMNMSPSRTHPSFNSIHYPPLSADVLTMQLALTSFRLLHNNSLSLLFLYRDLGGDLRILRSTSPSLSSNCPSRNCEPNHFHSSNADRLLSTAPPTPYQ